MAAFMNAFGSGLKRTTGIVPASSNYTCVFYWTRITSEVNALGSYRTVFVTYDGVGTYVDYTWLGTNQGSGQVGYLVEVADGGGAADTPLPGPPLYAYVWHKMAIRRTGTLTEFFADGVLIGSITKDVSADNYIETWLGYDGNGAGNTQGNQFFNFREWNAALTDEEIAAEFYSNTAVRTANLWCDTPLLINGNDISGNGRNWTTVGGTSFIDPSATDIVKNGWGFRSSSTQTGTVSLNITKPTGTVDNDIMIMALAHKGAGFATVPAGWNLIGRDISGTIRGEAYWKRASGEGASYTVTGLADSSCGAILCYDGGLLADQVVDVFSVRVNAAGVIGYGDITPNWECDLILMIDAVSTVGGLSNASLSATLLEHTDTIGGNSRVALTTTLGNDSQLRVTEGMCIVPGATYNSTILTGSAQNVGIAIGLTMQPVGDTYRNRGYTSYARYYDTNTPPAITRGPLNGSWDSMYSGPNAYSIEQFDILMEPNKGRNASIVTNQMTTNVVGGDDMIFKRYWIGPCANVFYSGLTLLVNYAMFRFVETYGIPPGTGNSFPKIHVYVTQGATTTVRQTLINNSISGTVISDSLVTMRGLGAQALPDFTPQDGDYICIELGVNVPNFNPHAPPVFPPVEWLMTTFYTGTGQASRFGAAYIDGSVGESITDTKAGWIEFNWPIAFKEAPFAAPANDAIADAIEITSIPSTYTANTQNSQWTRRGVWYKWTAPSDMRVIANVFGSQMVGQVTAYKGSPGALSTVSAVETSTRYALVSGARAYTTIDAVSGTTYYFYVRQLADTIVGNSVGGALQFELFPVLEPTADDIFYPVSGSIAVLREGQLINFTASFGSLALAGCAIDYSKNPMWDFSTGVPVINTSHRFVVGVFNLDYVEVLDVRTLNVGQAEIDFSDTLIGTNLNSVEIDIDGMMYVGWFGNGFKLVSDNVHSFENSVSALLECRLNRLLATHMSQQPGAPYTPDTFIMDVDKAGTDYMSIDVARRAIQYTSSGQYVPVGGTLVKQWDLINSGQGTDFATLPAGTGPNAGPKGIKALPDGGVLVCNGSIVQRLNVYGALTQIYTPSIPTLAATLADVDLTADGTQFWVMDSDTATFWKFDLVTGAELGHYWLHLGSGNSTSFVLYRGDVAPLTPITPGVGTLRVVKRVIPAGAAGALGFDFTASGGLAPGTFTLNENGEQVYDPVNSGVYALSESAPAGWTVASASVSNGSPINGITVADGEDVVVTFLNVLAAGAAGVPQSTLNATLLLMRRLRRFPHISAENFRMFYHRLQIDMEMGVGLAGFTAQGVLPQMMLRWSDDGGKTWSNEHWVTVGRIGKYGMRALFNRLGNGRDRVFEIVVSDPVAWRLVDAYLQMVRANS